MGLASRDMRRLDELSAENKVASVSLSVSTPAAGDEWRDLIDSVKEEIEDPGVKAYLRRVAVVYSLDTAATRNDLSLKLQEELWRMLGVLSHGLMVDPQEEEIELFHEGEPMEETILDETGSEAREAPDADVSPRGGRLVRRRPSAAAERDEVKRRRTDIGHSR